VVFNDRQLVDGDELIARRLREINRPHFIGFGLPVANRELNIAPLSNLAVKSLIVLKKIDTDGAEDFFNVSSRASAGICGLSRSIAWRKRPFNTTSLCVRSMPSAMSGPYKTV
jgi:hypothetical protein